MRHLEGFYTKNELNSNIDTAKSLGVADPFIYRFAGKYYLFFTAPKGLMCYETKDLMHYKPVDNGINKVGFVCDENLLENGYAPEVIYFNGKFYLVCSPNGNGHFILVSESIIGPYEFLTNNINEKIDGSFFIDNDGEIYFSRASDTGIVLNKMNPNFKEFKLNLHKGLSTFTFDDANIGRWSEGPFILKRYGKYYLTYCGTHFLSNAYRVNYCFGEDLKKSSSLTNIDTLLLSTKKDFYGLGHSMTFLGPDLDSYLIAYHDMNDDGVRTLNISRLLFSNEKIVVNDQNLNLHPKFSSPDFESYDENNLNLIGNFKLTPIKISKKFSIEYVFKGTENKLIFAYINESNYFYISVNNNSINIIKVIDNNEQEIFSYKTKFKVNLNVIHTIRIQYKNGDLALYFDNIEIDYKIKISKLKQGFVGFSKETTGIYLGFSSFAFGDSDNEEVKLDTVLATNYDLTSKVKSLDKSSFLKVEGQDKIKYFIYKENKGKYFIDILMKNVNERGKLTIKINNKVYQFSLKECKNESLINFGLVSLNKGINEIEIFDSYGFQFQYLKFDEASNIGKKYICFNKEEESLFNYFGKPYRTNLGIYYEDDRNFIQTKAIYQDFDVLISLTIRGNAKFDDQFAGLVVLNENYGKDNAFEGATSLDGYILGINSKYCYVIDANFDRSIILRKLRIYRRNNSLRIIKNSNKISFYINDNLLLEKDILDKQIRGKIGLYNVHTSVLFHDLIINTRRNENE